MYRSNESALRSDMISGASTALAAAPKPARSYATARAAARPILTLAAFLAGRQHRAVQLSWVGLVRR